MKKRRLGRKIFSLCIMLTMMLLMVIPGNVFAEGEEPLAEDPNAAEDGGAPIEVELVPTPTLTPTDGEAEEPVSEEEAVVLDEEPTSETLPEEEPLESLTEVVEALSEEEIVLVDAAGEEVPLATTEAVQALSSKDPWFDAGSGVIVGYCLDGGSGCVCAPLVTECNQVANPVQAAIDDARSDGKDITIEGTYYEQVNIVNKNVNLIGATTGGGISVPASPLTENYEIATGQSIFSLVYIEGGTVNLQGLVLDGTGNSADDGGSDYYAGVTFNNASGSITTSTISNFVDLTVSDQAVGALIVNSDGVTIEQNIIEETETGVLVENSKNVIVKHNKINNLSNDGTGLKTAGVDIQNSEKVGVFHNTINDINKGGEMRAYGINVVDSQSIKIEQNTIFGVTSFVLADRSDGAYGISIYDSVDVDVWCNNIYSNQNGILIDESSGWTTLDIHIWHNNIYNNQKLNLIINTTRFNDVDKNFWGVSSWPQWGGWEGGFAGYYETTCDTCYDEVCEWKWWLIIPYWSCYDVSYDCNCRTYWVDGYWEDGFKKQAKLGGTTIIQGEIDPPLYAPLTCCDTTSDFDNDGVFESDNCPWNANADQADSDNDGVGDACDATLTCPAGTFLDATSGTCKQCAAGTFSGAGASECTPCTAGTISGSGAAACTPCTAGTYEDNNNCVACDPGYVSDAGAELCTACGVGTYDYLNECVNCSAGTANALTGQVACNPCTPGYVSDPGAEQCTACSAGTFEAGNMCLPCSPGTANDLTGQITCTTCSPGYYSGSIGQTSCSACSPGSFASGTGSVSCTRCSAQVLTSQHLPQLPAPIAVQVVMQAVLATQTAPCVRQVHTNKHLPQPPAPIAAQAVTQAV